MGDSPIKLRGFAQGIMEISATAKEMLGTLRILQDGRKFRYALAGTTALVAGKMGQAAAIASGRMNQAITTAAAIGTTCLTLTVTAGEAIAENALVGGFLQINDAAGEGYQYLITSNSAITAARTSIVITIENPGIRKALTTSSEYTLAHSPWSGVVESATEEALPVGIPPVDVTASYYYWAQTAGPALALIAGTPAVGSMLTLSSTAGALTAINATLDIDQPICGISWGTVGVATEYKPVFLKLD